MSASNKSRPAASHRSKPDGRTSRPRLVKGALTGLIVAAITFAVILMEVNNPGPPALRADESPAAGAGTSSPRQTPRDAGRAAGESAKPEPQSPDSGLESRERTSEPSVYEGTGDEPGGTIVLAIGGTAAGVNQDVIRVAGAARLAGTLYLEFDPAFTPTRGQQFTVLEVAGRLEGRFADIRSNRDVRLDVIQDAHHVVVTVAS